jgi:rhodanese-related sulfurtransferase
MTFLGAVGKHVRLLLFFFAASCASMVPPSREDDSSIDPKEARRLVEVEHALLLDVRTTEEYLAGHIPGAKNISVEELSARLSTVTALTGGRKDHPIVVYCRSGRRAERARRILLEAGFTKVVNLGAMSNWPGNPAE